MQRETTGHFAQLTAIFMWSAGLIVQKALVPQGGVGTLLFLQFSSASALLWIALAALRSLPRRLSPALLSIAWGMMAPGFVLVLSLTGSAMTDGVSVSLIWGVMPILGPFLAVVLLNERLHWSQPVGAAISFGGLIALVTHRQAAGSSDMTGNLLVFFAVVLSSLSAVVGRRLNTGEAPWYQTATLQLTGASIVSLLIALLSDFSMPDFSRPHAAVMMLYLVAGMTLVNFLAFNLALTRIGAAWVSLYAALIPATGAGAAYLILGSRVTAYDLFGILVIVSGAAFPHGLRILRRRTPSGRTG